MKKFTIRGKLFPTFGWSLMLVWSVIFLTLLLWSMITSFKSIFDFYLNPVGLPIKENGGWVFENYTTAINAINVTIRGVRYGMDTMLKNSLLFAVGNAFFRC